MLNKNEKKVLKRFNDSLDSSKCYKPQDILDLLDEPTFETIDIARICSGLHAKKLIDLMTHILPVILVSFTIVIELMIKVLMS